MNMTAQLCGIPPAWSFLYEVEKEDVYVTETRATAHEKVDSVRECVDKTRQNAHLSSLVSPILRQPSISGDKSNTDMLSAS